MTAARCGLLFAAVAGLMAGQVRSTPEIGYPGGRARVPVPKSRKPAKPRAEPLLVYRGTLESKSEGKFVLKTPDGVELAFAVNAGTLYFRKDQQVAAETVLPGAALMVEARQDKEAFLFAVNVVVEKEPAGPVKVKPAMRAPRDPDDPGPPALRRGKPARVATPQAADSAPEAPEAPPPEDPNIVKAREVAAAFTETLPNYIVKQFTTRYSSQSPKTDWKALDILSSEVIYLNGRELYRDIRIDNKPVKKPIEELRGSTSHGEFGTTLADILRPATSASFTRMGTSDFAGRKAWKYDINVEREHSHWLTRFGSHSIRPAYHGTLWIDPTSRRVLRIELQARKIPVDYPLDVIEWVVEYGNVRIGGDEYLLPVHAEVLGCLRGTSRCSRNATDFRNYRRFTAESEVYAAESTIDFGKEVAGQDEKPRP